MPYNLIALRPQFAGSQLYTSTAPTSSVFSVGNNAVINGSGNSYISYCFAPVEGYSAFGSYESNNNADGPFVYTGFTPKFLLLKAADTAYNWFIYDTERDTFNMCE